tara:strand:- start:3880 stop:5526 length:1647 start_codon:yes stop_codon:yes gene_type:complete
MHIIIPMSGIGKRFIDAGYTLPKPLIEVDGQPIIEHVCNLFPEENKFTFICNSNHLKNTNMREILIDIKPKANILEIPNHKKGPVYAVTLINDYIQDDEEVIVNYCDFGTYWDYNDFLYHTRKRNADGAIPAYKNFHPHMLGSTNYAFIKDKKQWAISVKEKESFTNNRMNEYASNGTYYFKRGFYVKKYFKKLIDNSIHIMDEFYVSLVYNLMLEDGLKVSLYNIQHMLQWGTPSDLEEYKNWSRYFQAIIKDLYSYKPFQKTITLIPMAGRGKRFSDAGFKTPKPFIDISGKPMVIQAVNSNPISDKYIFVALKEHIKNYSLKYFLDKEFSNYKLLGISSVTQGQAITCSKGLAGLNEEDSLLITASDNAIIYDTEKYQNLISDKTTDGIIFTFRNNISSRKNPHMFGWVKLDENGNAIGVSVKKPISATTFNDHAISGTFYFKKIKYFNEALVNLMNKKIQVNNEYYVDSMMGELIKLGYKIKIFEVEHYISWGTPEDYNTYIYWQSFFHKSLWHPYYIYNDLTINKDKIDELENKITYFKQDYR